MRFYLLLLAGILMLLSALAHGLLGWPAMRGELDRVGAGTDLAGALAAGWFWGSAAMTAFGLLTVVCALRFRRGDPSGRTPLLIVSACYVLFGLAATLARGFNPHFLLFLATGLLAGGPVLFRK